MQHKIKDKVKVTTLHLISPDMQVNDMTNIYERLYVQKVENIIPKNRF